MVLYVALYVALYVVLYVALYVALYADDDRFCKDLRLVDYVVRSTGGGIVGIRPIPAIRCGDTSGRSCLANKMERPGQAMRVDWRLRCATVDSSGLVIQADLPTVLAVSGSSWVGCS